MPAPLSPRLRPPPPPPPPLPHLLHPQHAGLVVMDESAAEEAQMSQAGSRGQLDALGAPPPPAGAAGTAALRVLDTDACPGLVGAARPPARLLACLRGAGLQRCTARLGSRPWPGAARFGRLCWPAAPAGQLPWLPAEQPLTGRLLPGPYPPPPAPLSPPLTGQARQQPDHHAPQRGPDVLPPDGRRAPVRSAGGWAEG
jgi:hypothetical protein